MRALDLQGLTSGIGALALAEKDHGTQIATALLATKYSAAEGLTAGAKLGKVIAEVPALLLGDRLLRKVQVEWVHRIAAAVFAAIDVALLLGLQA